MSTLLSHPAELHWYALYTRSRTEKKVYLQLLQSGIETFLPLRKELRQWSDRKKWVEEPLFRSYIFVRISEKEYLRVIQTLGIVRYVVFSGKAAAIPDWQIESLRLLVATDADLSLSNEHFKPGDPVKVVTGALAGFRGEVVELKGRKQLILRIDHLGLSLEVNVPPAFLQPLSET